MITGLRPNVPINNIRGLVGLLNSSLKLFENSDDISYYNSQWTSLQDDWVNFLDRLKELLDCFDLS